MLRNILLSFIPLFVAVDAPGVLPIFVALTEGLNDKEKTKIIIQSMLTAFLLAVSFILVGKLVFKLLGISIGDFMVAGGAVLFCIAIIDLANPTKERRMPDEDLGAVPLGTPLIVGPAVLATSLLMISEYVCLSHICRPDKGPRQSRDKGPFKDNELVPCRNRCNAHQKGNFIVNHAGLEAPEVQKQPSRRL